MYMCRKHVKFVHVLKACQVCNVLKVCKVYAYAENTSSLNMCLKHVKFVMC